MGQRVEFLKSSTVGASPPPSGILVLAIMPLARDPGGTHRIIAMKPLKGFSESDNRSLASRRQVDRCKCRALLNWRSGFVGARFDPAAENSGATAFTILTGYLAAGATRWRRCAASPEPGHQLVPSFHYRRSVCRAVQRRHLSGQCAESRSSGRAARISVREGRGRADQGPAEDQRCEPAVRRDDPAAESGRGCRQGLPPRSINCNRRSKL